ncbi:hypothetical protein TNCV_4985981 [Trichonephila clavipes]|nr:hypothetical protein TNCV_4985981 [Trichonephila clavipes]
MIFSSEKEAIQILEHRKEAIQIPEHRKEAIQIPEHRKEAIQIPEHRKEAERKELDTTLGEIALISCPIPNCPSHTLEKIQSVTGVTNLGTKNNEKVTEQNLSIKDKNNTKNKEGKNPQTHKRTGQEVFKAPHQTNSHESASKSQ